MAEWGGYRRPSNPAPVSGPGALSQRTDGGVPKPQVGGLSYGENSALQDVTSAAPLARASGSAPSGGSGPAPFQPPVSLADPTAYPGQPVTAGADAGAGPGTADIGLSQDENHEIRQKLGPYARTLMRMSDSPYATSSYKRQVRQLLARINS